MNAAFTKIDKAHLVIDEQVYELRHKGPVVATPAKQKFLKALPWLLFGLVVIGLAVSSYFNWTLHQEILALNQAITEKDQTINQYKEYTSSLNDDNQQLQDSNSELHGQIDQLNGVIYNYNRQIESLSYDLSTVTDIAAKLQVHVDNNVGYVDQISSSDYNDIDQRAANLYQSLFDINSNLQKFINDHPSN